MAVRERVCKRKIESDTQMGWKGIEGREKMNDDKERGREK